MWWYIESGTKRVLEIMHLFGIMRNLETICKQADANFFSYKNMKNNDFNDR